MASSSPTAPSIWSDLPRRLTTITLGVPLVLCILYFRRTALLFFQGVHLLACVEWINLVPSSSAKNQADRLFAVVSMVVAQLPSQLFPLGMLLAMALLYLVTGTHHLLHGLLLITWPFHVWYQVSQDFSHTVTLLFIVWNCDTGALVAGRLRKMLIPTKPPVIPWLHAISPAKSLVGMWGGVLLGTLTTMGIPSLWNAATSTGYLSERLENQWWLESPWNSVLHRVLLGLMLSLLAILGDLVESAVKRGAGKKDAGKLLPGHGGILDRFDSSLLAVVAYQNICMKTN